MRVSNRFDWFFVFIFVNCFTIYLTSPLITYGVQIFTLGVLGIIFFIRCNCVVSKKYFLLFLLVSFLLIFITLIQSLHLVYQEILWLQVFRVLYWLFFCFLSYPFLRQVELGVYEKVLKLTIVISSFAVILQFFSFFVLGQLIDYSMLIGGVPSRIHFFGVFRPSGLTSEPSIHSGIMIGLLALLFILNKRCYFYTFLGLLSVFLTMSVLGIMLGIAYLCVLVISNRGLKFLPVLVVMFFVVLSTTSEILYKRYDVFISGSDSSNNSKLVSLQNLISEPHLLYLGYGMGGSTANTPWFYEGLYDVTAYGAFIITFGVPLGMCFCFLFVTYLASLKIPLAPKMLVFLVFIKITLPILSFFILFIMMISLFSKVLGNKYR